MFNYLLPLLFALLFFGWYGMYKGMKSQLNADGREKLNKLKTRWEQRGLYLLFIIGGFFLQFAFSPGNHLIFNVIWVAAIVALAITFRKANVTRMKAVGLHEDFIFKTVNAVMIMQISLVLLLVSLPPSVLHYFKF
jgi:hypothetical protein